MPPMSLRRTIIQWTVFFAVVGMLVPHVSAAGTLFQSTNSRSDEVLVYTPRADDHNWFNNNPNASDGMPTLNLGTWTGADFTTNASTTIHLWARWNDVSYNILDVLLSASSGG